MNGRPELMEWIRGEIVGPSRWLRDFSMAAFNDREFYDGDSTRKGPLAWRPQAGSAPEEVLYYERETPHRKYGAGLLHPAGVPMSAVTEDDPQAVQAAAAGDTQGVDIEEAESDVAGDEGASTEDEGASQVAGSDDFDVSSPDVRHPSTIGISFCARFGNSGTLVICLPRERTFAWQASGSPPFALNGRYEKCIRRLADGGPQPAWRRQPATPEGCRPSIGADALVDGRKISVPVAGVPGSPLKLLIEAYPRRLADGAWLITVVLRNVSEPAPEQEPRECILYQTHFEVALEGGLFEKYPESQRPFHDLDEEEKSLALLYRESATWGIGHGCAAGWDSPPGCVPDFLRADVFPATELPSVTADIRDASGNPLELSMRLLSDLSDDGEGPAWNAIDNLAARYLEWIEKRREDSGSLLPHLSEVAVAHLDGCSECHERISAGIALLRDNSAVRRAFRLANEAMLLQQVATKRLSRRALSWDPVKSAVFPRGAFESPARIVGEGREGSRVGSWRAFQIAFLLMSLRGVADGRSPDRELVDLIWFPTGGGKTEAYLGVLALYLFHERFLMIGRPGELRDGTNAFMRYTLRMLTTQQFQRAAALICAMEVLRRRESDFSRATMPGSRFSLGLWIGSEGSPNSNDEARTAIRRYRDEAESGNPMVLTECPWCRAEIGRVDGSAPRGLRAAEWRNRRVRGISDTQQGPRLHCTDPACDFGTADEREWLPVEVIDERIYANPPSLVIATADKFAMIAYRPKAGALFGNRVGNDGVAAERIPPGLIIQDELHLISGPLGTMYALYEGIVERLCSVNSRTGMIRPKLIASTATIRGAVPQVMALYDRRETRLFPSPGLTMGDSFFGTYARHEDGKLKNGRMYLGVHASDYGSILTTQVRLFSSACFRPQALASELRDPWWTLLVFYNSIRELGGAKTLFDSDIRSRLKFMFNREGISGESRRNLRIVEELTSRLSQSEIVRMMDRLSVPYAEGNPEVVDACLASNIIEVGVDIDRLSVMGVVGQPKTTAQYIQVTGRVGRRWDERPGLILTVYSPAKSRDRSHFEQFYSYHARLYERVEPTTATPFSVSAIQRGLPGALLAWARQHASDDVGRLDVYGPLLDEGLELLSDRCRAVQAAEDLERSLAELERVGRLLEAKWARHPQQWEEFPPCVNGEYLMLWPGQFATRLQKDRGVMVASSMRQVDGSAELRITPV